MRALPCLALVLAAACGSAPAPAATTPPEPVEPVEPAGDDGAALEPDPAVPDQPAPDQPAAAGGGLADAFVRAHNQVRARHCAPPLRWSAELARVAQAWADQLRAAGCAFEHSQTRYGENLAAGTSGALDPASTVDMWYREVDAYDFARGGFSMKTGHFTQVVWRDTTAVGCGVTTCNGMDLYVCNYDPPGNVQGQYRDQVRATGCP